VCKKEGKHTENSKPSENSSPPDSEEQLEPKKVRQCIKIVGRTVYCSSCAFRDVAAQETAGFYCGCGVFLCSFHILTHKCMMTSSMEYDAELIASLA
jgi:hypothetical protein